MVGVRVNVSVRVMVALVTRVAVIGVLVAVRRSSLRPSTQAAKLKMFGLPSPKKPLI